MSRYPASVRACGAETDPGRRLACYDREVARFGGAIDFASSASGGGLEWTRPRPTSTPDCPPPARLPRIVRARPMTRKPTQPDTAAPDLRHLSARVVSIGGSPDELVLHLDNGQVWEQIQPATAELNLHKATR